MQICVKNTIENVDGAQWDHLASQSQTQSIFQTFGWHQAWWEECSQGKEMFLVCAEEQGMLCGLAPLMIVRRGRRRVLKFMGTGHSDYCDFIYPKDRVEIARKILDHLARHQNAWDEMALDYIPNQSQTIGVLAQACAGNRLFLHAYAQAMCPTLRIDGDQKNARAIARKKASGKYYKYFSKKEGYGAVHLTQEQAISPYLEEFFNQHIQRRSATTAPSLFLNPANRAFYKNLLSKLCPSQKIVFSVVKAEGKAIAFHFGFVYGRTLLYYKPTFDLGLAAHSPGKVLLKEVLEHALARDCQEFDFSVGQEAYKMDFANHMKTNSSFKVFKTPWDYWASRAMALIRGKRA